MSSDSPFPRSKCTWSKGADPSTNPHNQVSYCRSDRHKILPDVLHSVGDTPLIRLSRFAKSHGLKCELLAKCEFFNPGGSIKDRIAIRMIEEAEKSGLLKPGGTVIESTAGNTGIGVAMASAAKGYKCIIVMSVKFSDNKADIMKALGAEIIRVPIEAGIDGPDGEFGIVKRLHSQIPNSVIMGQFVNRGNPLCHYDLTATELYEQCDGKIDMLVAGASTGGTITGITRKLRDLNVNCVTVAADVKGSALSRLDKLVVRGEASSLVEGIGFPFVSPIIDRSIIDCWLKVDDAEAFAMARSLHQEEAILCGGSSGGMLAAAVKAAANLNENQRCVVILPDGARNYTNTFISDQWMEARDLKPSVNLQNHWWWDETVAALKLKPSITIREDSSCSDALDLMKQNDCRQIPVTDSKMSLKGVVTISNIMNYMTKRVIELDSKVTSAVTKDYRIVDQSANLGLVSRILEIEPFVLVNDNNCNTRPSSFYGIITTIDLLQFIQSNNRKSGSVISNGIK